MSLKLNKQINKTKKRIKQKWKAQTLIKMNKNKKCI